MNKPKFTKGKWTYFPFADCYIKSQDNVYSTNICKILEVDNYNEITNRKRGNAELIAATGTTATKLHDMGIDPIKAFESLPEILEGIDRFNSHMHAPDRVRLMAKPLLYMLKRLKLKEYKND